jgi:nucleoside-diphosphate kinase
LKTSIFKSKIYPMNNYDNRQEKTLVIVKPDGVQRSLIGEVIKRYEQCGLKLIALKMLIPTEKLAHLHYHLDPEWPLKNGTRTLEGYKLKGKKPPTNDPLKMAEITRKTLTKYLTSGPVVAMIWQGMNAVTNIRKITGHTEPSQSVPGTIRGDYTIDSYDMADLDHRSVRNVIHASGSVVEAETEINLWFKPEEILNYRLVAEEILYDSNLDGILE